VATKKTAQVKAKPKAKAKAKSAQSVLTLHVQSVVARVGLPTSRRLQQWAEAAYRVHHAAHRSRRKIEPAQVSLRIVGSAEGRKLNRQWRDKDYATNVLSFPAGEMPEVNSEPVELGDIVICAPVIKREAREQGKTSDAHWAHMMIHGVLHLLGHDHEVERDAQVMEACEVALLAALGFDNPYGD
jgi:probable rRNA maturation factor